MDFKLIKNEPGGLPEFEELCVLLSPVSDGKYHAHLGVLMSIDKDGPVFKLQNTGNLDLIMDQMFGSTISTKTSIKFTHWSKLVINTIE